MTAGKNHNQEKKSFHKSKRGVLFRTFRPLILAVDFLSKRRLSQVEAGKDRARQLNVFAIN
jgi:hypothetical protein